MNQFNLNIAKAEIIREKSLTVLEEAFSYRIQLQSLDVEKYYPKSNERLETQLKTLVNHSQTAGNYTVRWDATNISGEAVGSGIYAYKLRAGKFTDFRKMVLIR